MKTLGIGLLGATGLALAGLVSAPGAAAQPCSASGATNTIGAVSAATSQFLIAHPDADRTLSDAISQSPDDARASVRAYFTAHPDEYVTLRGITAPLVDLQHRCGSTNLPSNLVDAFDEFQAG